MQSRQTLQTLVSLQGDPLSMVNESKLNRKGRLHSGQIFRSQVLPAIDWMRWAKMIRGDNSGNSTLFLQSCLHDAQVVVTCRKPALRNIKLLVGSGGLDFLL